MNNQNETKKIKVKRMCVEARDRKTNESPAIYSLYYSSDGGSTSSIMLHSPIDLNFPSLCGISPSSHCSISLLALPCFNRLIRSTVWEHYHVVFQITQTPYVHSCKTHD